MKFGSPAITFVYHIGVHCTDENTLVRSLMKNGNDLNKHKIILPRPRRYRKLLVQTIHAHRGDPMPEDQQKELFDTILMGHEADRVILGFENFLGPPQKIFEHNQLYGLAGEHSTWLRYLFPENPCEFFLSIRDPATFVPAAMLASGTRDYKAYTKGVDPRTMRWSRVIEDIQENNPDCAITVWCNEDTPLIWPSILRELSDAGPELTLDGELDLVRSIMTEDGFKRMESYLGSHPPPNEVQRRRVFAAFLDKFAIEEALEEDIEMPYWSPELIDEITANYDDDVYKIERMAGVNFISA